MHNATTVADRATPSLDHVCPTRKPPQPWLRHATPSLPRQLRLHAAVAADHSQRSHRDLRCAPHTATTVAVSFSALTATTMADLHHTTSWPLAQCPARALDATTVADSQTGATGTPSPGKTRPLEPRFGAHPSQLAVSELFLAKIDGSPFAWHDEETPEEFDHRLRQMPVQRYRRSTKRGPPQGPAI